MWVREPDDRPTNVLVKVSLKVERDPERRLLVAEKANPACDLSWSSIVELSIDKIFIWPPSHRCGICVYPGPCTRRVGDSNEGRRSSSRRLAQRRARHKTRPSSPPFVHAEPIGSRNLRWV